MKKRDQLSFVFSEHSCITTWLRPILFGAFGHLIHPPPVLPLCMWIEESPSLSQIIFWGGKQTERKTEKDKSLEREIIQLCIDFVFKYVLI